jgi:serine/threonine protein kinase
MAQLFLRISGQKTLVFPLEERVVSLGRASDNAAQVDEPSVSRHHARLTRTQIDGNEAWLLEDLKSANGSQRNGIAIEGTVTLQDGDDLQFGSVEAVYFQHSEPIGSNENLPAEAPEPGGVLAGIYRVENFLGEGPCFRSYRAFDTVRHRAVAVQLIDSRASFSNAARGRLAQAVRDLQGHPHPNVLSPLTLEQVRNQTFLVFEWIDGLTLLDLLRHRQALAAEEALLLLAQAAAAMDHARDHGLPDLDINLRAALLTLASPAEEAGAGPLLKQRLDSLPSLSLKLSPLLVARGDEDHAAIRPRAIDTSGEKVAIVPALGALLCELMGHAVPEAIGARQGRVPRIVRLGEGGNEVLRCALVKKGAFGSGREFCTSLYKTMNIVPAG